MTVITPAQAYTLARGAGFNPATAAIMAAIAGGESGYRTDAVGDVGLQDATWGPSVGLWQIRSLKAQSGTGQPRDATRLTDPTFNARSAFSVYNGQGLSAWSVYTNKSYLNFMGGAQAGAAAGGAALPAGSATQAGLGPFSGWNPLNWPGQLWSSVLTGAMAGLGPFLITWGFVAGGAALVIVGATVTAWPTASKLTGGPA